MVTLLVLMLCIWFVCCYTWFHVSTPGDVINITIVFARRMGAGAILRGVTLNKVKGGE